MNSRVSINLVSLQAAVAFEQAEYVRRNPRSAEIAASAATYLPGGNTRSSLWYDPFPLCMVRGEGSHLVDADGHEYVDFLGEFTAGIYGHSSPVVKEAIVSALQDGLNLSAHNQRESQLAAMIGARFPSMQLLRFTNSGTEANLMALEAAKAFTRRTRTLVFEGAYHGCVLAFGPTMNRRRTDEFVIAPYNDESRTRALIEAHRDTLAAILVEPMLGAGGCIPGTPQFLHSLRRIADETGAVLIFDEIQTARLSLGGRQQLLGLSPDLTTIGKFFGGGLAFGCFGGRRDIMQLFDPRRPDALFHPGTFNNNTLTMAAGAAALGATLTAENLDRLNERGERLRQSMLSLFESSHAPFTVTGLGSIMNIHPLGPPATVAELRKLLFFDLLDCGIYLAARGLIALSLAVTDEEIARLPRTLQACLEKHRPQLMN
ncbi:MAG TPA: aminotransferase class III-fold pyridoxal phosphate-dependent enzyme [Steroidobacteraceae bacterium]|jgi:glutamate-1-semialdehyde 2,1-aminomutase|nr:aminotransferase class III-fold pyridoxal phosphate-dependent enzyme [Steroidobacteraceae bacterium]